MDSTDSLGFIKGREVDVREDDFFSLFSPAGKENGVLYVGTLANITSSFLRRPHSLSPPISAFSWSVLVTYCAKKKVGAGWA